MDEGERKIIEDWAKKAGFNDEDMKAVVDLEMKLKLGKDLTEKKSMMVS